MRSVKQDIPLPAIFCNQMYLEHAFNWTIPHAQITNPHLWQAIIDNAVICISDRASGVTIHHF